MIINLIIIGVTVLGLGLIIAYKYCDFRMSDAWEVSGVVMFLIGLCGSLIVGPMCLFNNSRMGAESTRIKLTEKRNSLIYRLENYNTQLDSSSLIDDVVKYNTSLLQDQYFLKSKWTNWFYNPVINEFEPIDYSQYISKPIGLSVKGE